LTDQSGARLTAFVFLLFENPEMSNLLTVGRVEGAFATEAALTVAKEFGALPIMRPDQVETDLVPWLNCPETICSWDSLNEASLALLLDHAAELEGIPAERRIGNSKWPHLPDYQETYWLPLDFPSIRVFKSSDGWPIAVASAVGLLRNLEALKEASSFRLDEKPGAPDPNSREAMSHNDALRWTWCCLHEAVSIALANDAVLALSP
jgi:hypothetical protein